MIDWNPILLAVISTVGGIIAIYLKQIHTAVNSNYTKITEELNALRVLQSAAVITISQLQKDNAVLVEHIRLQQEIKNAGAAAAVATLAAKLPADNLSTPTQVEVVNPATHPVPVMPIAEGDK